MGKTIAFSGYRAEKLPENIDPIRVSLMDTVKQSIDDGFDTFLCGMADGFDLMSAGVVLEIKEKHDLKLICVIPFEDDRKKSEAYMNVLKRSDDRVAGLTGTIKNGIN